MVKHVKCVQNVQYVHMVVRLLLLEEGAHVLKECLWTGMDAHVHLLIDVKLEIMIVNTFVSMWVVETTSASAKVAMSLMQMERHVKILMSVLREQPTA
jgi:hypothetical protein